VHRLWLRCSDSRSDRALNFTLYLIGAPPGVKFLASSLIALLIGFEAATLWR